MNYRADIQGLRGFAVLAVLADHFAPDIRQTSGGFVGVDIFFVISGFLITSLIQRDLKNQEFSLSKFWVRRIKRIFPSLLMMLIVSSILLWGLSTEYGKGELLKNLIKATTFSSNFGYTVIQDYFAGQSQNPLLHLWSLAIEEQFYLVWPLICMLLFKLKRGTTLYFSYLIVFLSFTANLMTVYYFENKSFAFYNTFTRIWELMLGAILAQHLLNQDQQIQKKVRLNHVLAFGGTLLVAASLCIITQDSAFPGYLALMPTIGTVAIIAAGPHNFISRYLFGNPLIIWFGGISYSLYLWHFPMLFVMRLLHPGSTNFQLLILIFVLSILFAFISTNFIETPFRQKLHHRLAVRSLLLSMLILLVFASATQTNAINKSDPDYILDKYSARGWGNQSDLDCVRLRKEITVRTLKRQECFDSKVDGRETVFLVGDSHSGSLRSGLKPYLKSKGIALRGVSTGWCGWYEIEPLDDDRICASITQEFLSAISITKPKLLIIDGYWAKMAREVDIGSTLIKYVQLVQLLGVEKVVVVGQIPTYEMGLPKTLQVDYLDKSSEIPDFIPRDQVVNDPEGIEELMKSIDFPPNVYFRSLDEILCKNNTCRTTVGPNLATDLIVWDYGHVTESGALFLSKIIFKDIEKLISD